MPTVVVAIGGNALVADNEHSAIDDQRRICDGLARVLVEACPPGWQMVVSHGNGPQVGFILRRSELVRDVAPEIPAIGLGIAVADSQGGIGHLLALSLASELRAHGVQRGVAALVTHALVDMGDPSFAKPSKPIGMWMRREEAARLAEDSGWIMAEEPRRGWRRLVASPAPIEIVESEAVASLLRAGFIVVAGGGGGVPVVRDAEQRYRPVDAVIDKDHSSSLLAAELGADLLVLTTGVDQVALDFGLPSERPIGTMTSGEAGRYLEEGQFPPGSMGPKIEASLAFLQAGGKEVLITSLDGLRSGLVGSGGTRVVPDSAVPAAVPGGWR